jgi:CheY-like chemotaxis protein
MTDQPIVLYVEDDPQSRTVMRMLLKRLGLSHVTILENSADFLTVISSLEPKPNVIFLDIHMEPYSGFEMLQMLRQLDWASRTPVFAITASVMNEEIQQLRTAGFSGCLAKPLDLSSFPDTFNRILAGETIWRITEQSLE